MGHETKPAHIAKAAFKPVLSGLKAAASLVAAHLPPKLVATVRDVVRDATKGATLLYNKAVESAGQVLQEVSHAAQAASEFAQAAMPIAAGILAGGLTTAGCLLATGGAGSAACAIAGFAVGSAVTSALSCPPGKSIAGCAARGAVVGAVAGAVFVATGGTGGGLSAAIISGGASSMASSATEQVLTTGSIDTGEVLKQGVLGAATGGITHGAVRKLGGCNSFAPGTAVLMADGTRKPIEDVKAGDKVKATDPTTGKTTTRAVTHHHRHRPKEPGPDHRRHRRRPRPPDRHGHRHRRPSVLGRR